MKSRALWASETSFLNDQKEIEHAKDYVQLAASNLPKYRDASQFSSDEKSLLEEFEHCAKVVRSGVCVVSFSEERDSLSQWRAYGGKNESFSIGLSSAMLRQCAENENCLLGQCTYDHSTQYIVAQEIVLNLINRYRSSDKSEEAKKELCNQLGIDISKYGPLLKHRSFAEEKEWRIVTPQISVNDKRWDYRTKGGRVTPFVHIDIERTLRHRGKEDSPLIIVGPGRILGVTDFAVQSLAGSKIGPGVEHGPSDTPFRQSS